MISQDILDGAVLLHEGKQSLIYKVNLPAYGGDVIVKVLREQGHENPAVGQLLNEFNLLSQLNAIATRAVLDKININNYTALVLAYAEGYTLKQYLREQVSTVSEKLRIAIRLCQVLDQLHHHSILHGNLCSENIIIQPQTLLLTIIDFGSSVVSPTNTINGGVLAEIDPAYMAPELSGKLSAKADERADLYSLGVVLYELFGGSLPFQANLPQEYIHAHMALLPEPLHQRYAQVPRAIGEIVQKLLAKIPEDRYYSAVGVQADLEQCLEQWEQAETIEPFALAVYDKATKLRFSPKLFGREAEFKILNQIWQHSYTGAAEVVWISGPAGVGKSALASQVQPWTRLSMGNFASGKFEVLNNNKPYSALVQALGELIDLWLTKSQEEVAFWRKRIRKAVGEEGRLLTGLVPRLSVLLGEQPVLSELEGLEAQNRFVFTFRNFLSALSCQEYPLVLQLEDLHWADSATLSLLHEIFDGGGDGFSHILLLGTYRSDELAADHVLLKLFKKPTTAFHQHHIVLENLPLNDISHFLADTFQCELAAVVPFAQMLNTKTSGNPLFMRQFLQSVVESKLLYFDYSKAAAGGGSWQWDLKGIATLPQTDNVLLLLSSRIQLLEAAVRHLLQVAASIGGQFSQRFLFSALKSQEHISKAALIKAVREGLLVLVQHTAGSAEVRHLYRFGHDRLQQAAYLTLPEQDKLPVHLRIGRLLRAELDQADRQKKLFDVVMHLNLAKELLQEDERIDLAQLNLQAAQKAMDAAGYHLGLEFLQEALKLLPANRWEITYDFALLITTEAAFAAYLCGEYRSMNNYIDEVVQHARQAVDKAKVLDTKLQAQVACNQGAAAVDTALAILHELGVRLPRNPSKASIIASLLKTELMLKRKGIDKLASLPRMTDPQALAVMQIMASAGAAVSRSAPTLFPLFVCKLVQMSLKKGNAMASIPAYSGYGILQTALFNKAKTGYSYGKLAEQLLHTLNAQAVAAKTYIVTAAFLDFWVNHLKSSIEIAGKAYKDGLKSGDKEFAASGLMVQCIHGYIAGEPLPQLAAKMEVKSQDIRQLKQELHYQQTQLFHQVVINLMQEEELTERLQGEVFDEENVLTEEFRESSKAGVFYLYLNKLLLCYMAGRYSQAQEYSAMLAGKMEHVMATAVLPVYVLYDGLLQAALYDTLPKKEQRQVKDKLSKAIGSMRKWSRHAPMNFLHKLDLLQAEWYRINGNTYKARMHYESAAQGAHEQEYLQEKALSFELLGRFLLNQSSKDAAYIYLLKAYKAYLHWGAKAKAKQLLLEYPFIHTQLIAVDAAAEGSLLASSSQAVEVSGILEAATVLSSEMQLNKMLENLLKIVVQQAGAQEVYLLLDSGEQLEVVAHYRTGQAEVVILPNIPLHECKDLPAAIINYTFRTQQEVVLPDAQSDKRFSSDLIVAVKSIRSVVSVPIVRQGRLIGIIYMHNTLATGAFTVQQLQVLRMLSGQIAVSLENALLYTQLEQKVEERTQQLKVQQNILEEKNKELYGLNEEKDDLVNIVAHDLRSPLNQIRGMLNLIMMAPTNLNEDQKQFITLSLSSAERLSGMIARILDVNAIENNKINLNLEILDLGELLDEVVLQFQVQAAEKEIVLQLILPEEPVEIELDKNYTIQILENLISNALKFSPPDASVQVVLYTDEDLARIEVTDEGPGISNKDQKRLFSKFQTLSARPTAGEDSTGLGLSIAKRYVDAMGGNIGCSSEMGEGSTFFVEFVLV